MPPHKGHSAKQKSLPGGALQTTFSVAASQQSLKGKGQSQIVKSIQGQG